MPNEKRAKKSLPIHDKLREALSEVDRPSEVCTSGDRPLTMPGLEVDGLGEVRLPLGKAQARKLIKLCRQAPYGKGTETVIDTDVRRVWELDPRQFQLTNPKWNDLIASIIEDVREELGLADRKLTACPRTIGRTGMAGRYSLAKFNWPRTKSSRTRRWKKGSPAAKISKATPATRA